MGAILLSILVVALTVTGITLFMMWLTEKATHASLTDRFRDAETIVNDHQVPTTWLSKASPFKAFMQGRLNLAFPAPALGAAPQKAQLLKRLDDLILYFETCPFFDSEDSRDAMLDALWLERDRWEALPLEDIKA